MWLPWQPAVVIAAVLVVAWGASKWRGVGTHRPWLSTAGDVAREAALVLFLYAVWQISATVAITRVTGALAHGNWVWHVEHLLRLPSELGLQRAMLHHRLLTEAANRYYEIVHVPALIAFLLWTFVWHRRHYPAVRNTLAIATGACLLVQMIPVAPPRFLPQLGFVDTGVLYHQSVYGPMGTGISDQLAAMPSIHVAWAVLVGVGVVLMARTPWRWVVLAHPVLTVLVVVATGNHWWLDGIVAVVLLGLAWSAQDAVRRWARSAGSDGRAAAADVPAVGEQPAEPVLTG